MIGMKILDLFCGAGGASVGLHRVFPWAQITGVDIVPQKHYPFDFVQADALEFPIDDYHIVWASPPCQAHSNLRALTGTEYPDFISATRLRLRIESRMGTGRATIIENVVGAPLVEPIMLCGSMFGLGVWRHRLFECSFPVHQPQCDHDKVPHPIDVTGTGGRRIARRRQKTGGNSRKPKNMREANAVMGIDWMTRKELSQAIPPAYSEFIGKALLGH